VSPLPEGPSYRKEMKGAREKRKKKRRGKEKMRKKAIKQHFYCVGAGRFDAKWKI